MDGAGPARVDSTGATTPIAPAAWLRWAGWILLVLVAGSVVVRGAQHDQYTQDTQAVIDGVNRTIPCLREGLFSGCGYHPDTQSSDINPYPLLQYLPAFAFRALRLSEEAMRTALIWCNTFAVAATMALVTLRARRSGGFAQGVFGAIAVGTGMLVTYAGHSFGEPLVVLAVTALCVQCLDGRRRWWTSIPALLTVAFAGAIGKETMAVSSALFAGACLLLATVDRGERRRRGIAVGVGLAMGVGVNLLWNVFRFGGLRNVQYFRETRPGLGRAAVNTVSLIVAPNGGLLWFWFAAAIALGALVVVAVLPTGRASRPGGAGRVRWAAAMAFAGFAAGWLSQGLWWGPFGWYSWGPRLLLPYVVPCIVVALEVLRPTRVWVVGVVTGFAALLMVPMLGNIWNREAWTSMQLATYADRPACVGIRLDEGRPYEPYHDCLMEMAWRTSHMPLSDTITTMPEAERVWFWTTALAALAAVGVWSRRATAVSRDPIERGSVT